MRSVLVLVVTATLLGWTADRVRGEGAFFTGTFDEALAEAKARDRVVMVDFYTTWCGPCKLLDRYTWPDTEVQAWLKKNTVAMKVDADRNRPLAARYRIRSYPTMVFIAPDGREIDRTVGFQQPRPFLANAARILAKRSGSPPEENAATPAKPKPAEPPKDAVLERMKQAQALSAQGKHDEALQSLIWCLDHDDRSAPGRSVMRRITILEQIAALGRQHPPAMEELDRRKKSGDQTIRQTIEAYQKERTPFDAAALAESARELAALGRLTGDPNVALVVFDALGSLGAPGSAIRRTLLRDVLDVLLNRRRYEDIVTHAGDVAQLIDEEIGKARMATSPGASSHRRSMENLAVYLRQRVAMEGAKYYEALLGVGRYNEAQDVAKRILDFDASTIAYQLLITHALRVAADEAVKDLVKRAERELRPGEMAAIRKAAASSP